MSLFSQGVPSQRNGDTVIGFVKGQDLKTKGGYQDWSSLQQWYEEDPAKRHIKMVTSFGEQSQTNYPLYEDLWSNKAVVEVNGEDGKFTYDYPIETVDQLMTIEDRSGQLFAGQDGTSFKIVLNEQLAPGTVIGCDAMYGQQIVVSNETPVRASGDGFEHTMLLATNDTDIYYDEKLLGKGIQYFVIAHGTSEFGTELALVRMPNTTNYMTCEFQLGSISGAETFYTGKANSVDLGEGFARTKDYLANLKNDEDQANILLMTDLDSMGKKKMETTRVSQILEYLTIKEFFKNQNTALAFGKAYTNKSTNGVTRYTEGLWTQLRRGRIITYAKRGGITKEKIKEAVDYIFKINPTMKPQDREITFKCGTEAFQNVLRLFDTEFIAWQQRVGALLGSDRVLPKNPVSGDLMNLKVEQIRVTNIYLSGIGQVNIIEDQSLNYMGMADRNLYGMHANGYAHSTYSMVIYDAMDKKYSNNTSMPKGTKMIDSGNSEANVYLVQPKEDKIYWGRENGRYSSMSARDIVASNKFRTESFFIYGAASVWVKDPTKFVMIELDPSARQGFN
jgi:hypothetical protein